MPRGPFSCIDRLPNQTLLPADPAVPPDPDPGACHVCCGPASGPDRICFACRLVARRLGAVLSPVLPMQLCPLPGPLYTVLKGYKEAPVAEARDRFGPIVRSLTVAFLHGHAGCIDALAGGRPHFVLPVPSTLRPGGSPIARVPGLAADTESALPGVRWTGLLCRTSEPVGHMQPSARAFAVPPTLRCRVAGRSLILLDDTYVSGARSQSAAAALRRAGAASVVVVALGRVLRPDRVPAHADFLARRRADRHDPVLADPGAPCLRCVQRVTGTE